MALPHAVALAIAAFVGGFLVGRYGGDPVGRREATLAGLMAGIVALVLAFAQGGISWPPLVVVILATVFSALGGARGRASVLRQA
jgi:MFS family permease